MLTSYVKVVINGQTVDIDDSYKAVVVMSIRFTVPEDFSSKQSITLPSITVPATKNNNNIFNRMFDPHIKDYTPDKDSESPMKLEVYVAGILVAFGYVIITHASRKNGLPESYTFEGYANNGDWIKLSENMTLWDNLNTNSFTFDLTTIQGSWSDFMSDSSHDIVFFPVRYRQPFQWSFYAPYSTALTTIGIDDSVNAFHLRPAISAYWLLMRGFNQIGYNVQSDFLNSDYFKGMALPWTWGNFLDITGDIIKQIGFKAVGCNDSYGVPPTTTSHLQYFPGISADINNTLWSPTDCHADYPGVIISGEKIGVVQPFTNVWSSVTYFCNFFVKRVTPPLGFDLNGTYHQDISGGYPGGMVYNFNPPANIAAQITGTVNLVFTLNLLATVQSSSGYHTHTFILITILPSGGGSPTYIEQYVDELSVDGVMTKGSATVPTVIIVNVPSVGIGDTIIMQIEYKFNTPAPYPIIVYSANWVNKTEDWTSSPPEWGNMPQFTTLELTSIEIPLGGTFNLQWYDVFKKYKWHDYLRGLINLFNLEITTDQMTKTVIIEPMYPYLLPNESTFRSGFYSPNRQDWSNKVDRSKSEIIELYSQNERQFDFTFKQDGTNDAINIWTTRYQGMYPNKVSWNTLTGSNVSHGLMSALPGAARFMFSERFDVGVRTLSNPFFAPSMHVYYPAWQNLGGSGNPPTQILTMFPQDTGAANPDQSFEPQLVFYKGLVSTQNWRFIGDPNSPYDASTAIGFQYPFAFAVNYIDGANDPIISFCDENIAGTQYRGLLNTFYAQRLAIMEEGKIYQVNLNLKITDVMIWIGRYPIIIDNNLYFPFEIDNYNPASAESVTVRMWKVAYANSDTERNIYPSTDSIISYSQILTGNDLRYAQRLVNPTDLPQV